MSGGAHGEMLGVKDGARERREDGGGGGGDSGSGLDISAARRERKKMKKELKAKAKAEEEEEAVGEMDPELAAMLGGAAGFGGGKNN